MATGTALRRTLLSHRRISSAAGAHRPPAFEEVRASAGTHESRPFSSTALGLPGSARNWRSFSQLSSTQDADGYQGKGNLESKSYVAQIVNALRLGEREMASTLLSSLMSKKNCLISENFSYILDFCAQAPDPLFPAETWRLLEENKIELDSQCWISIIKALCKGGYFEEVIYNHEAYCNLLATHTGNPVDVIKQRVRRLFMMKANDESKREPNKIDRKAQLERSSLGNREILLVGCRRSLRLDHLKQTQLQKERYHRLHPHYCLVCFLPSSRQEDVVPGSSAEK